MGVCFSSQSLNVLAYLCCHSLNLNINMKKQLMLFSIKTINTCTLHLMPPLPPKRELQESYHMVCINLYAAILEEK